MARLNLTEESPYLDLLEEAFPGIKANILRCEKLGFPWQSKPFLKENKGELLSHVGFLEYPIRIDGRSYKAAALHAICTKTAYRGQGLASQLIQEALQWAKNRYEFVILFTGIPKFYEQLSFQKIQEYRFYLACKRQQGSKSLRPLTSPQDNALLSSCFQHRAPLSNGLFVEENGAIAAFNTLFATYPAFWSLSYSPSIQGLVSYEIKDKTLHLYDIISKELPSLDLVLDHLPAAIDQIYFYFSPDRFTDRATKEPYLYDHGHFLVHGSWPATKPFMIPALQNLIKHGHL